MPVQDTVPSGGTPAFWAMVPTHHDRASPNALDVWLETEPHDIRAAQVDTDGYQSVPKIYHLCTIVERVLEC